MVDTEMTTGFGEDSDEDIQEDLDLSGIKDVVEEINVASATRCAKIMAEAFREFSNQKKILDLCMVRFHGYSNEAIEFRKAACRDYFNEVTFKV